MKKIVKTRFTNGSMYMVLPKDIMMESKLWGDKTLEVELKDGELIIRKSEKDISEAMKLIEIFGKSYFIEKRKERCKLRREERKRKWKEKIEQIKLAKQKS